MNLRIILIGLAVVALAQIMLFNYFQMENLTVLSKAEANLDLRQKDLQTEKGRLLNRVRQLKAMVESMPPYRLSGFEDPEAVFVDFLDYLQARELTVVQGPVRMSGRRYVSSPLPLHARDFSFRYNFVKNLDAEKFLSYLLFQDRFFLEVKNFSSKKLKKGQASGDLTVTLMTPARFVWQR